MACLRAKPIVDGLAAEWGDQVQVVRLNVQEDSAQPLLAQLGFRLTPTFILFDATGQEIWRANGVPDANELKRLLRE